MDVTITTLHLGDYRHVDANRAESQVVFTKHVCGERQSLGAVLDIGCGPKLQPFLKPIAARASEFHGVDPSPAVTGHPTASQVFPGTLESAALPTNYYDTAIAYNVVEHVEQARPFFTRVHEILRPGGAFWAITPHGRHPFARIANAVRVLSLKGAYRGGVQQEGVNDYPAYYRLNTPRAVVRATRGLGFARADFWYVPSASWHHYFPRPLRSLPRAYDRLLGTRYGPAMLTLMYRLTKAGQ